MLRSLCCLLTIFALAAGPLAVEGKDKEKAKGEKAAAAKKEKAEKKPKAENAAKEKKAKKAKAAAGVVKAVDADAKTITITKMNKKQNTSEDKTYTVADDATVSIKGEAKTLADIAAGTKAKLKLSDDGQKVVGIEVGHAKKKQKKAE